MSKVNYYYVEKQGVYGQGVFFITESLRLAINKAKQLADNDTDDYHQWNVIEFIERTVFDINYEPNVIFTATKDTTKEENKKLREGQEWVSVENELPDDDGGFLTVVEGDDDTYINYFVELGDQTGEWQTNQIVTHWKPLPSPPQDKEL